MKLAAGVRLSLFDALIARAACQRDHGASAGGVLPDLADRVEHVSPSVVNISTVPADAPATSPTSADPGVDGSDADSLKDTPDWFKRFLQQHPDPSAGDDDGGDDSDSDGPATLPPGPQSLGSGLVLWTEDRKSNAAEHQSLN